MPTKRVKLLSDNRLVGTHVYRTGDVFDLNEAVAKAWIKAGQAAETTEPLTELKPRGVEPEKAVSPMPAKAERAVARK